MSTERDRKQVTQADRVAVAAEIRFLLAQRDEDGKRRWSQTSLGIAAGGLSQESIRRAIMPDGVGPAVRDGILALSKLTIEELRRRHGVVEQSVVLNPPGGKGPIDVGPMTLVYPDRRDPDVTAEQLPKDIARLRRLTIAKLMSEPFEYEAEDAERMVEGLLYARKHVAAIDPDRLAQLAHLTEQELRGLEAGTWELSAADTARALTQPVTARITAEPEPTKKRGKSA